MQKDKDGLTILIKMSLLQKKSSSNLYTWNMNIHVHNKEFIAMWRNQSLNIGHNFLFGLHIQKQWFAVTCPQAKAKYLVCSTNNTIAWNSSRVEMLHLHQVKSKLKKQITDMQTHKKLNFIFCTLEMLTSWWNMKFNPQKVSQII